MRKSEKIYEIRPRLEVELSVQRFDIATVLLRNRCPFLLRTFLGIKYRQDFALFYTAVILMNIIDMLFNISLKRRFSFNVTDGIPISTLDISLTLTNKATETKIMLKFKRPLTNTTVLIGSTSTHCGTREISRGTKMDVCCVFYVRL